MPRYNTAKPNQITVAPRQIPLQGYSKGTRFWNNDTERQDCCMSVAAFLTLILIYLAVYAHVVYLNKQ